MPITPDAPRAPRTISEADIAQIKAEHPEWPLRLLIDERNGDEYVFRVPGNAEYSRFKTLLADETMKPTAMKILTDSCAVKPDGVEFGEICKEQPALRDTFGNKLLEQAGLAVAVTVKKL